MEQSEQVRTEVFSRSATRVSSQEQSQQKSFFESRILSLIPFIGGLVIAVISSITAVNLGSSYPEDVFTNNTSAYNVTNVTELFTLVEYAYIVSSVLLALFWIGGILCLIIGVMNLDLDANMRAIKIMDIVVIILGLVANIISIGTMIVAFAYRNSYDDFMNEFYDIWVSSVVSCSIAFIWTFASSFTGIAIFMIYACHIPNPQRVAPVSTRLTTGQRTPQVVSEV